MLRRRLAVAADNLLLSPAPNYPIVACSPPDRTVPRTKGASSSSDGFDPGRWDRALAAHLRRVMVISLRAQLLWLQFRPCTGPRVEKPRQWTLQADQPQSTSGTHH